MRNQLVFCNIGDLIMLFLSNITCDVLHNIVCVAAGSLKTSYCKQCGASLVCVISDGKYHEQIKIAEDATGYSYEALFKPYISSLLTEVWVEDPYIRHIHQVKTLFNVFAPSFCLLTLSQLKVIFKSQECVKQAILPLL